MAQSLDWRTWDWDRIAEYFVAARGRRSQQSVADAIGVSVDTIQNLEGARRPRGRKPQSAEPLATYYGWKPGSLRRVGLGEEPELYDAPAVGVVTPMTHADKLAEIKALQGERAGGGLTERQFQARLQALLEWPETQDTDGQSDTAQ